MGALFGSLTSLCIGLSDLALVGVLRRAHVVTVTVVAMVGAMAAGLVGLLLFGGDPIGRDLALGAGSGLFMAIGLMCYFVGLQAASVGVVSPLVAVQTALWPLVYDVLDGARPSRVVWIGLAIALVSLLLTTFSPELEGRVGAGVRWGLVSGSAYGLGVLLGGLTDEASGMWPVLSNRSTSFVVAVGAALVLQLPLLPARRDLPRGALGGVAGGLALLAYVYGTQNHDLGVVGVTGSLFPAVSAYLLYRFLDHPLRWWQAVGIGGVLAGTALVALG